MIDVYSMGQLIDITKTFKERSMLPQDNKAYAPITWYRGQSNSNYQLVPSLYRMKMNNIQEYINFEARAIDIYMEQCKRLNIEMEDTSWNIFYSMQHYGVKTRALDWSEKASIGLFFAFEKWNPEVSDAALFLLNPIALNFIVIKKRELLAAKEDDEQYSYKKYLEAKDSGTIAVEPRFKEDDVRNVVNRRIIQQAGRFTLHETKWPLEAEIDIRLASAENHLLVNRIKSEDVILKLNLKREMYDEVRQFLQEKSVNHSEIYPDIEGVANLVNRNSLPNHNWYNYF